MGCLPLAPPDHVSSSPLYRLPHLCLRHTHRGLIGMKFIVYQLYREHDDPLYFMPSDNKCITCSFDLIQILITISAKSNFANHNFGNVMSMWYCSVLIKSLWHVCHVIHLPPFSSIRSNNYGIARFEDGYCRGADPLGMLACGDGNGRWKSSETHYLNTVRRHCVHRRTSRLLPQRPPYFPN